MSKVKIGPITYTEHQWNDMFSRVVRLHNDSRGPVGAAWIEEYIAELSRQGFTIIETSKLEDAEEYLNTIDKTRAVWRN